MSYIYLTHAERESSVAQQLKQFLNFSFETWCPVDDLSSDEDASEVIPQKIKGASALLVILSKRSEGDKRLLRELAVADKHGVPMVAVCYGEVELSDAFEYYFTANPPMDISNLENDLSCLNAVIAKLKQYGGRKGYDDLIDIAIDEETEKITLPEKREVSPTEERVKELCSLLPPQKGGAEPDYQKISETEEILSTLLSEEGISSELSLATDGPSFTRFLFSAPSHIEKEAVESLQRRLDDAFGWNQADCYFMPAEGLVIDLAKRERSPFGILPFLKSEAFTKDSSPVLIAGKDVNDNCAFIDFANNKFLLVIGDDKSAREKFLDLCYLSLRAKFTEKEMQVVLTSSVAGGLAQTDRRRRAVLLLTDVEENGLYEELSSLPENVFAVAEVEDEDIPDLSLYTHRVILHRDACRHHASKLAADELIYKTPEFILRVLPPAVTTEEGETVLHFASEKDEEEKRIIVELDETPAQEVTENAIEEVTAEEVPEEPAEVTEKATEEVPEAETAESEPAAEETEEVSEPETSETEPSAEEVTEPEQEILVEVTVDDEVVADITEEVLSEEEGEEPTEEPSKEQAEEPSEGTEETKPEAQPSEEQTKETADETQEAEEPAEEQTEEVPEEVSEEPKKPVWTKVPEEEMPNKLYLKALAICIHKNAASISILQQRPLYCNFSKAMEIYSWMVEKGYLSEADERGNRTLLVDEDDFETLFGDDEEE